MCVSLKRLQLEIYATNMRDQSNWDSDFTRVDSDFTAQTMWYRCQTIKTPFCDRQSRFLISKSLFYIGIECLLSFRVSSFDDSHEKCCQAWKLGRSFVQQIIGCSLQKIYLWYLLLQFDCKMQDICNNTRITGIRSSSWIQQFRQSHVPLWRLREPTILLQILLPRKIYSLKYCKKCNAD